jgi:hypothetical protein
VLGNPALGLHTVGGVTLGTAFALGGVGVEGAVDFTDRRSPDICSELRRYIDYMSVTPSWGR